MGIYADLTTGGVSTRVAADLVGVPRATATRKTPSRSAAGRSHRRTSSTALSGPGS